jgi:hypothetical protein
MSNNYDFNEENYDLFRRFWNPILIKFFGVEFVKITINERFVGVGIRLSE